MNGPAGADQDGPSSKTPPRFRESRSGSKPPMTRGINLLSALSFAHRRGGRKAIADVLRLLPEDDLKLITGDALAPDVHPRTWYPFEAYCRILANIDRVLGDGDRRLLHEVGKEMAQRDIRRIFRPLLKLGRPGWILEFHKRLWRTYHDHGEWTIDRTPVSLIATLSDQPGRTEDACAAFMGWMEAALKMSGAVHVDGSHPVCIGRGGPHCVFTCRWETESTTKSPVAPHD